MPTLAYMLALVFFLLALVHVYWACGGRWGAAAAVPQKPDGQPVFIPGAAASLTVALGLLLFGCICLVRIQALPAPDFIPPRIARWALLVMAAIFLLRAIGDRRYCGLMRKINGTYFARQDRKYFTPLCAALALALLVLALC